MVDITPEIKYFLEKKDLQNGMLNISILHTTASLVVQENADGDVLIDLENFYNKIAPFSENYNHRLEGDDDMPAHIKSSLTNSHLTLSVLNSYLNLGKWQSIFLFEHKFCSRDREILLHYLGN